MIPRNIKIINIVIKTIKILAFIQSLFLSSESAYGYKPDADTWHPVRGAGHVRQWHPQSHGGSRWFSSSSVPLVVSTNRGIELLITGTSLGTTTFLLLKAMAV